MVDDVDEDTMDVEDSHHDQDLHHQKVFDEYPAGICLLISNWHDKGMNMLL